MQVTVLKRSSFSVCGFHLFELVQAQRTPRPTIKLYLKSLARSILYTSPHWPCKLPSSFSTNTESRLQNRTLRYLVNRFLHSTTNQTTNSQLPSTRISSRHFLNFFRNWPHLRPRYLYILASSTVNLAIRSLHAIHSKLLCCSLAAFLELFLVRESCC